MSDLQYLDLHGERVAYREAGTGSAVLLIHGMASSSHTWRAMLPGLSTHHRVVAPDLLGHGQSAKPRGDYSLGAFAVWLRDLLDELGIQRVTLVGHSLGGGVAMQFVHQHPEYCERLVLLSSGGLGPELGRTLRLLSAPGAEFVLPMITVQPAVAVGNRAQNWLAALGLRNVAAGETWNAYKSLADHATRIAFLRTLRGVVDHRGQAISALNRLNFASGLPVLVIWGDRDPIIPVSHAQAVAAALADSQVLKLPGVGHYPHIEAPSQVMAILDDFIATTTPWRWRRKSAVTKDQMRC